jgi:hypothetical protein
VERQALSHPSPTPSHSCFLRGVGVLHVVREKMRESVRSLQSSEEWEDVAAVSTPCRWLILSIYLIFVGESRLQVVWIIFLFHDF